MSIVRPSLRVLPLLLLLVACKPSRPEPAPPPVQPAPSDLATEQPETRSAELVAGVILSRDGKLVTAEVEGRVEKLVVQHGQRVRAGEPLVVVDDTEMKRQLESARGAEEAAIGQLRSAQTARAEAGRQAQQQSSLYRDGAVSRDAVSSARSAYAMADAQVQAADGAVKRARAQREQAEQLVAKTTIVAPMDGVITLVKVTPGQMLGRGQPIARIFDPSDLWVRFALEPHLKGQVRDGTRIQVTPVSAGSKRSVAFQATVRVVHRTLEPPLQLAVVEADLDDARLTDHDALLGMMVDVRLP